jgi:hypothetical protein
MPLAQDGTPSMAENKSSVTTPSTKHVQVTPLVVFPTPATAPVAHVAT